MEELLEKLAEKGKNTLKRVMGENQDLNVLEYSKKINDYKCPGDFETELREAFTEELISNGKTLDEAGEILENLEKRKILQTAPHTKICQTPRILCIDFISTTGMAEKDYYIVGSFSGVPFSNATRPGRITAEGRDYNFVPATHQDALVYGTQILEKTLEEYTALPARLKKFILDPKNFSSFAAWANKNSESLHQKLLHKKKLIYLDINSVIRRYLLKVIEKPNHIISKILFDKETREKFIEVFGPEIHLFYSPYTKEKYSKQESLYFDGYDLSGAYSQINLGASELREALINYKICPATILTFTALAFINKIKCFGSLYQTEYLPEFKEKWLELGLIESVADVPADNLTTGKFPDHPNFTPLDFALANLPLPSPENIKMKDLWLTMKEDLLA